MTVPARDAVRHPIFRSFVMRRIAIILVVALALPAALRAQNLPTAAAVARLTDSLAAAFLAANEAPSVAIAVVRGSDTIVMKGWGKANLEHDIPATERSVYRIGSITKQFTAAAVMRLVEQNEVGLEDSIAAHLPGLPAAWRGVTVRQLLNHTSGIPSYTGLGEAWRRRWGEEMTPDTLVALTASAPMWFAPGTSYRYDNTGYVLLGMLVEKHAGRPWATEIEERFGKPLGLSDTRNCGTEPVIPRRVAGYDKDDAGRWGNTAYLAMSQPYAAGALCSTVGDLVRWNQALHGGKVVIAASYAAMTTPAGAATKRGYGFGLARDSIAGRPAVVHGGGIHGFSASNAWVPSARLSVTVLANSSSADSDELLARVARAALGAPIDAAPRVVPLAAADRDRYAGVYALELPNGVRDFTIAIAGDALTAQLAGEGANPIIHYGSHTFGAAFDPKLRLVFTVEGGRATKVTLTQGGGRFDGKRK